MHRQREFIVRHIDTKPTATTSVNNISRRLVTNVYFFTVNGVKVVVCKKFFLNTLGISEKFLRQALMKVNDDGVIELEKRGGRSTHLKASDIRRQETIINHINRFLRIESHYIRKDSTRLYLSSELTVQKMGSLLLYGSRN